jgi:hypothetical protein
VTAKDKSGNEGDLSEKRRRKLAAGVLKQNPQRFILIMRNAGQRRFDVTPDSLGATRTRISVIVSRPIRLRAGAPA